MPRTTSLKSHLVPLVEDFAGRLAGFIEQISVARAREAVLSAIGTGRMTERRGPGRPRGAAAGASKRVPKRKRKKGPIQLCPVPSCKNRAAPVFGMVCKTHKDVPKAQIQKYRAARRASKAKTGK